MGTIRNVLAFALAAVLAGCGSTEKDPVGDDDVPLSEAAGLVADAFCGEFEECISAELRDYFPFPGDCTDWFTNMFAESELPQMEEAIEAGTLVYDGTELQDCLDAIADMGCDLFSNRLPDICEDAFDGQVDEGGDCGIDAECDGEQYCYIASSCPGTCRALETAGGECDDDDQCANGLTCQNEECRAPAGEGEDCEGESDPDCEVGLFCIGQDEDTGQPGTCGYMDEVMTNGEGEECDVLGGDLCELGLSCVLVGFIPAPSWECQAELGSGEDCTFAFPDQCPDDEFCDGLDIGTGDVDGTCEPLPGEGDACAALDFAESCAGDLTCVEDECTEVQHVGGSCAADEGCYSDHCEDGECTEPPLCDPDDE